MISSWRFQLQLFSAKIFLLLNFGELGSKIFDVNEDLLVQCYTVVLASYLNPIDSL